MFLMGPKVSQGTAQTSDSVVLLLKASVFVFKPATKQEG